MPLPGSPVPSSRKGSLLRNHFEGAEAKRASVLIETASVVRCHLGSSCSHSRGERGIQVSSRASTSPGRSCSERRNRAALSTGDLVRVSAFVGSTLRGPLARGDPVPCVAFPCPRLLAPWAYYGGQAAGGERQGAWSSPWGAVGLCAGARPKGEQGRGH